MGRGAYRASIFSPASADDQSDLDTRILTRRTLTVNLCLGQDPSHAGAICLENEEQPKARREAV